MNPPAAMIWGQYLGVCADRDLPWYSGPLDSMGSESQGHFKAEDRKRDFHAVGYACFYS